MIDIHCHILPGIDDGARSENEVIEMAQAAVNSGIKTVIATPHHKNKQYENDKKSIREKVAHLNKSLEKLNIPLDILPGQEVHIFAELIKELEKGTLQTLNDTKYLLLELPSDVIPQYTEQLLFDIQLAGITPIIAHPERNRELLREPNKLYNLISLGGLAQVTAGSLTGAFGGRVKRVARQMIKHNLIHFIASDTHNSRPNNSSSHNFEILKKSYKLIEKKYGTATKENLQKNAEYLINNENISRDIPRRIKKKRKFFGLF